MDQSQEKVDVDMTCEILTLSQPNTESKKASNLANIQQGNADSSDSSCTTLYSLDYDCLNDSSENNSLVVGSIVTSKSIKESNKNNNNNSLVGKSSAVLISERNGNDDKSHFQVSDTRSVDCAAAEPAGDASKKFSVSRVSELPLRRLQMNCGECLWMSEPVIVEETEDEVSRFETQFSPIFTAASGDATAVPKTPSHSTPNVTKDPLSYSAHMQELRSDQSPSQQSPIISCLEYKFKKLSVSSPLCTEDKPEKLAMAVDAIKSIFPQARKVSFGSGSVDGGCACDNGKTNPKGILQMTSSVAAHEQPDASTAFTPNFSVISAEKIVNSNSLAVKRLSSSGNETDAKQQCMSPNRSNTFDWSFEGVGELSPNYIDSKRLDSDGDVTKGGKQRFESWRKPTCWSPWRMHPIDSAFRFKENQGHIKCAVSRNFSPKCSSSVGSNFYNVKPLLLSNVMGEHHELSYLQHLSKSGKVSREMRSIISKYSIDLGISKTSGQGRVIDTESDSTIQHEELTFGGLESSQAISETFYEDYKMYNDIDISLDTLENDNDMSMYGKNIVSLSSSYILSPDGNSVQLGHDILMNDIIPSANISQNNNDGKLQIMPYVDNVAQLNAVEKPVVDDSAVHVAKVPSKKFSFFNRKGNLEKSKSSIESNRGITIKKENGTSLIAVASDDDPRGAVGGVQVEVENEDDDNERGTVTVKFKRPRHKFSLRRLKAFNFRSDSRHKAAVTSSENVIDEAKEVPYSRNLEEDLVDEDVVNTAKGMDGDEATSKYAEKDELNCVPRASPESGMNDGYYSCPKKASNWSNMYLNMKERNLNPASAHDISCDWIDNTIIEESPTAPRSSPCESQSCLDTKLSVVIPLCSKTKIHFQDTVFYYPPQEKNSDLQSAAVTASEGSVLKKQEDSDILLRSKETRSQTEGYNVKPLHRQKSILHRMRAFFGRSEGSSSQVETHSVYDAVGDKASGRSKSEMDSGADAHVASNIRSSGMAMRSRSEAAATSLCVEMESEKGVKDVDGELLASESEN